MFSSGTGRLDLSVAPPLQGCVTYETLCASALARHIADMRVSERMQGNALFFQELLEDLL